MYRRLVVVAFVAQLLATGATQARDPRRPVDSARPAYLRPVEAVESDTLTTVRVALLQGRGEDAARELEGLLGKGGDDELYLFLQASAFRLDGRLEQAMAIYGKILGSHPEGKFRHKAIFGRADILARQKRFEEAGELYRNEVLRITSVERKNKLAGIYIGFADSYFSPPEGTKPAYAKARSFYQRSLEIGPTPEEDARVRLQIGICYHEEKKLDDAIRHFKGELDARPRGPLADKMRFRLGLAHLARNQRVLARRAFLDLVSDFPDSDLAPRAIRQTGLTFGLPSPRSDQELEQGVRHLRELVSSGKGDQKLLAQALFEIGLSYYNRGKDEDAVRAFGELLDKYRGTPDLDEVPRALSLTGSAYFRQRRFQDAVKTWKEFLVEFPAHREWSQTQKRIIDVEFSVGFSAFRDERYDEAISAWEAFLERYPLDNRSPQIHLLIGKIHYEEKRFKKAVDAWRRLVSKYPGTEPASEGQYLMSVTLEKKLGKFDDAKKAYKELTWGAFQDEAKQRLVALDSKHLSLLTERAFTTGEPVHVRLTVRNIDKLELSMVRLDGKAYFRKMHTFDGMVNLDLALIEPDQAWKYEVPGYEKHREIEAEVTLPFTDAGLYVITASEEQFEATTVVLVTDIMVAVKTGRRDLLVFAQNRKSLVAEKGCEVLVSDGSRIILEGKTDARGFFYAESKELKTAKDLRVFAFRGQSYGGTLIGLGGVRFVEGLQPRGFVYSDRPAYRPGEDVYYRGVLREVEGGNYTFDRAVPYTLDVVTPTGDIIDSRQVKLSEAGAFAGLVALPRGCPLGSYKLIARRKDGPIFSGQFQVQEYQLPKMRLEVDVDRVVYFRGETIEGNLRALYAHGGPVRGRALSYQFSGIDRRYDGITNDNGELAFSLDTRDLGESQVVQLSARIADEPVEIRKSIWIATRGFTLSVQTLRNVYISGEGFDVGARARGVDGEAKQVDLELSILRIETEDGRRGEVEAMRKRFETDAETGRGKVHVKLEGSGQHILRVAGKDRFGNRIVRDKRVFISGEQDDVKLRILSDRETFRLGDKPKVVLHSRSESPLAILVYEGEGLHRYETRTIRKGRNELALTLDESDTPNFRLTALVLSGNRFDVAHKTFVVERGLDVALEPEQATATPGEEIAIRIRSKDLLGKGVPAELGIALVDETIFDIFPDPLPLIRDFFYSRRRAVSSTEGSTAVFRHKGQTRTISREIIEEERLADEGGATPRGPAINTPILGDLPLLGTALGRGGRLGGAGAAIAGFERFQFQEHQADFQDLDVNLNGATVEVPVPAFANDAAGIPLGLQQRAGQQGAQGQGIRAPQLSANRRNRYFEFAINDFGDALDGSETKQAVLAATGYWNPSIWTDASGRGEVRIKLPSRQARWRLISYGVTRDTLVGRGEASLQTKKDLYLELRHPAAVTEGDHAGIEIVVHNLSKTKKTVPVHFQAKIGDRSETEKRELEVEAETTTRITIPIEVRRGAALELEARTALGQEGVDDHAEAEIKIEPWGTELRDGAGGIASGDAVATLELPKALSRRQLEITIGPSLERSLLDLSRRGYSLRSGDRSHAAGRGLILLEVIEYLEETGRMAGGLGNPMEAELEGILAALFVNQTKDGGWSWTGRGGGGDPYVSASAYRLLRRARNKGLRVPSKYLTAAEKYLQGAFSRADDTTKSIILYALAHGNRAEYPAVNRLYRMRHSLDAYALAHLSLTLERLARNDLAREVVTVLVQRDYSLVSPSRDRRQLWVHWCGDPVEQVALAVLAIAKLDPRSPRVRQGIEWLQERRALRSWGSAKAVAAAAAALREYLTHSRPFAETYELAVKLGDKTVGSFRFEKQSRTERILLSGDDVPEGKLRVSFALEGNGTYSYTCVLKGWSDTIRHDARDRFVEARHHHQPAPRVVDGRPVPSGYTTVHKQEGSRAQNRFTELAIGAHGTISCYLRNLEQEGYLVHEEFLPAAVGVVPGTIRGDFQYHEIRGDRIVFYLKNPFTRGWIYYDVYGRLPGQYRMLPSRSYALHRPDRLSTGAERSLRILAPGEKGQDAYELTPDELYYIGKAHFDRHRLQQAKQHLLKYLEGYNIKDKPHRDTARMLLKISIKEEDSASVVRFFEILKERFPELELEFEEMLLVGQSYTKMGEHERALQVYRGIAEASFIKEGNIAGALQGQGEFLASLDFTESLVLEYPDLSQVIEAGYGLAHFIYRASGQLDKIEELRRKRISSRQLIRAAADRLHRFLLYYPRSPKADEAGFTLAAAYLDLGDYQQVMDLSEKMKRRFPESSYLDKFLYIEGYARFWLGGYQQAIELLARVEEELFPMANGESARSEERDLASYLIGQIYHAMRKPIEAIKKYETVREDFSDADEAIRAFEKKLLQMPEVSRAQTGKGVEIKIRYRNIPELQLVCYKVDLLKLYLLRRNLDGIARVNLAGIKPYHQISLKLGDGKDYVEKEHRVSLPLKETGAYLVVAKGRDLDASGMVLVSGLDLEIEEDVTSGRVRATVIRKRDRSYVGRAHVKVIGEGNDKFVSGETDLRGLFVADGLLGRTTVVAKHESEYAFFRGQLSLGGYEKPKPTRKTPAKQQAKGTNANKGIGKSNQKEVLEHNIRGCNTSNIIDNCEQLQTWFSNEQSGVQVRQAK